MIGLRINSFAEVEKEIMRLVALVPEAVATEAKEIVRDNSNEGIDIKGQRLKEYSPAYDAFRKKHGLPDRPPDLRVQGVLLDKQRVQVQGMRSSVQPSADRMIIAQGNMRYRKFYPETDSDIIPAFNDRIAKAGEKAMTDGSK